MAGLSERCPGNTAKWLAQPISNSRPPHALARPDADGADDVAAGAMAQQPQPRLPERAAQIEDVVHPFELILPADLAAPEADHGVAIPFEVALDRLVAIVEYDVVHFHGLRISEGGASGFCATPALHTRRNRQDETVATGTAGSTRARDHSGNGTAGIRA